VRRFLTGKPNEKWRGNPTDATTKLRSIGTLRVAMRGLTRTTASIDPSFRTTPKTLPSPDWQTRPEIIFKKLSVNSIKVRRTPVAVVEPAARPDIQMGRAT
jgi:hypothetical protein